MVERNDTFPRKEPTQDRSRALVDALIEATARILTAEGADAVTTNRVAEVAGASIGSLYQYFPNKEALLAALLERELHRDIDFARRLFDENKSRPLRELIPLFAAELVAQTRRRSALHGEILPLIDDLHRTDMVQEEREAISSLFLDLFMERQSELAPRLTAGPGPEVMEQIRAAAFVTLRAIELSLNAVKVEAPEILQRPDLADHLSRIFLAVMIED